MYRISEDQLRNAREHGLSPLVETYADGALDTIFGGVADSLKDFGSILGSSAKLLMTDVNYLVTITFSRLKTIEEYSRLKKEFNGKRAKHISDINSKSKKLMESWPDGKITSMMIAPGAFFTTQAISGTAWLGGMEARQHLTDMGFDKLPIIGSLARLSDNEYVELIRNMDPNDPEKSVAELRRLTDIKDNTGEKKRGLLSRINSIFLFAGDTPSGSKLMEGDDEEPTDEQREMFLEVMAQVIEEEWPVDRSVYIEDRATYFEDTVEEAENVITLNAKMSSTTDSDQFFGLLDELKTMTGDKGSKLDTQAIQDGFKKMGSKVKDDEEAMTKLKEELGEDASEEELNQNIAEICLDAMKSQFLPKMREGLTEFYDYMLDEITEEMSPEEMELLNKNSHGKEFNKQIKGYKKRLGDALSNLG